MRYYVEVRARAREKQPIPDKHKEVMEGFVRVPEPWGLGPEEPPPPPDPGSDITAVLSLRKFFGKGVYSPYLVYPYRADLWDMAMDDDHFTMFINPKRVDYRSLVLEAFPKYVASLGAYVGCIGDEEFIFLDQERLQEQQRTLHTRSEVDRVWPVSFYDDEFCQRAFGLSPKGVAKRLKGKVEQVSNMSNGVYMVGSSEVLEFEEADRLCWQMKAWIEGK